MGVVKMGRKGLTVYDRTRTYNGYNLFFAFGQKDAWLIDMEGRIVQRWRTPHTPGCHGFLLPNGNILHAGRVKTPEEVGYGWTEEFSGCGGLLSEIDWDSNIVWQVETPLSSHDFTVMPNGNIMYICWEPKGIVPPDIANKVKGGRPGTELNGQMWGDVLVEIDRNGKRVWEWIAYEHLDPEIDAICPLENRSQWPYINSVQVWSDGSIFLSTRYLNQVTRIDYKTGKVIGRYGRGQIYHQHDARELPNGNLLVLDNGTHRPEYGPEYSRVVEIDLKTDKVVWEYKADPPCDFFSSHSSGCERQPNGNTVIMETDKGRMFEVTLVGDIVWEYVNPRYVNFQGNVPNWVWRCHRYAPDYPGLKGRDLDPDRFSWENRMWGPEAWAQDIKPCIF